MGFAASLFSNVIVARLLGVDGKGVFTLFIVTVYAVSAFSGLGLGQGQMYYSSKSPKKIKHFMPNAFVLAIILGAGLACVYFGLGRIWQLQLIDQLGSNMVSLAVIVIPVLSLLVFQRQVLLATHSYSLSKVNFALSQIIPILFYAFIYLFLSLTAESLIIGFVASQILCLFLFQIIIFRRVPPGRPSLDFAQESVAFGIKQYLSDVVIFLTNRLDFFLVALYLGKTGLGIYSVAVGLSEVASRLPSEFGTILFPAFAANKISNSGKVIILRRTLFLSILGAVILAVIGPWLIGFLFGRDFLVAGKTFYFLLPGIVAWSTIYVTWNSVSAAGRPGLGVPIFGAAALLDVILIVFLIPVWGIVGVGIASSAAYCFAAVVFLMQFCKDEEISVKEALHPRIEDLLVLRSSVKSLLNSLSRV